ncbi:hypothetical protein Scep_028410 [Stephania cephalantha]|uniref:DUF4283 domain-containing protein n=1 Tax=Stephania cephalantha TaxID=152367 RepID=A0AAP0EDQ9_9MAGN
MERWTEVVRRNNSGGSGASYRLNRGKTIDRSFTATMIRPPSLSKEGRRWLNQGQKQGLGHFEVSTSEAGSSTGTVATRQADNGEHGSKEGGLCKGGDLTAEVVPWSLELHWKDVRWERVNAWLANVAIYGLPEPMWNLECIQTIGERFGGLLEVL